MIQWLENLENRSRPTLITVGLVALLLIGIVDYLTGFEIMFSVFYLLEVGLATWYLGKGFGLVMSILSDQGSQEEPPQHSCARSFHA